jgi:hypothetical protein
MSTNPNPLVNMTISKAKAKGSPISMPRMPHIIWKKLERYLEFDVF